MADSTHHITVACVVRRGGEFLFVEERVGNRLVINQPSGHWEDGETLLAGAVRETLEETGWQVLPTAVLGLYEYTPPGLGYGFLRIAFLAEPLAHDARRPLDTGIERAVWLTPEALQAQADRHRSPMVQQAVDDALAGRRLPLDVIRHLQD